MSLQAGYSMAAEHVQFILEDGDISTLQAGFDLSLFFRLFSFFLFF